jgi:hypothetical protein
MNAKKELELYRTGKLTYEKCSDETKKLINPIWSSEILKYK